MITYRKAKQEEFLDCIDLANYVFSSSSCPHDFSRMIPRVYGKDKNNANIHRVAVSEEGRLRALIACLPQTVCVCGHELHAGFIGTVSVHPRARGEGHMKALMHDWIEEMRQTCDLSVLGGQRQRYEYFGYTKGGVQWRYSVNTANVRHALGNVDASAFSFCPLAEAQGGTELAWRLNEKRPMHLVRSPELLDDALHTFGAKPLVVLKNGGTVGYLDVSGDGRELLEAAFSDWEDFEPALKAYFAFSGVDEISVPVPASETELNRRLSAFAEYFRAEPSEMFRIFNFANVLEAYLTLKHQTEGLVPGVFSAVLDGQPVTARVDQNGVSVERTALPGASELSLSMAQQLLLTPHGRFLPVSAPANWFPLPLFWYIADNF